MLVPTEWMGDGHQSLRGFPVHLQSWWWLEEDRICFGVSKFPEVRNVRSPLYADRGCILLGLRPNHSSPDQQAPLFAAYGVNESEFWREVDGLVDFYARRSIEITRDAAYLVRLLSYVEHGRFNGLTNERLRALGAEIETTPGTLEFFEATRKRVAAEPRYAEEGITVEHYVVSTGIRQMIEGSVIGPHLDGVWADAFIERTGICRHPAASRPYES